MITNNGTNGRVRYSFFFIVLLIGLTGLLYHNTASPVIAKTQNIAVAEIYGAIDTVSAKFVKRAISRASEQDAQFIVLLLDTPGGLMESAREMVEAIINSQIPVVVYVHPDGARAASAGTFLVAASHVAVMSRTNNIGAASPVGTGGQDLPEVLESKAIQDASAFIRSIANLRDRNSQALEDTVLKASSYTATEALNIGVIDLVARDMEDLLRQLDGRTVLVENRQVVLQTSNVELTTIKKNPVERFLGVIADPNIAFLLVSIGGIALIIELWNPGIFVTGIVGIICLGLGFAALGNLPVNWVGVALLAIGLGLIFAETQAPGVGFFGIGGGACFILGAFLLFGNTTADVYDGTTLRVSLWVIGVTTIIIAGFVATLVVISRKSRGAFYSSPTEDLVGEEGITTTILDPVGSVQVASERWSAVSDNGGTIEENEKIIVSDVEGLVLKVFRASDL